MTRRASSRQSTRLSPSPSTWPSAVLAATRRPRRQRRPQLRLRCTEARALAAVRPPVTRSPLCMTLTTRRASSRRSTRLSPSPSTWPSAAKHRRALLVAVLLLTFVCISLEGNRSTHLHCLHLELPGLRAASAGLGAQWFFSREQLPNHALPASFLQTEHVEALNMHRIGPHN